MDKGATNHVTNSLNNLVVSLKYTGNWKLTVSNRKTVAILYIGCSKSHCKHTTFTPESNSCVPQIAKKLVNISRFLHDNDIQIEFTKNDCVKKDKKKGMVWLQGVVRGGLYQLKCLPIRATCFES